MAVFVKLCINRDQVLSFKQAFVVSYFGNIRGAVTFALIMVFAAEFDNDHLKSFFL